MSSHNFLGKLQDLTSYRVFQKAFTLIELMIVVAIVALLAATASVSFQEYLRRSKTAEVPVMLDWIAEAQITHLVTPRTLNGIDAEPCFAFTTMAPIPVPGSTKAAMVAPGGGFWRHLGFEDGETINQGVYFSYSSTWWSAFPDPSGTEPWCPTPGSTSPLYASSGGVLAIGDLDGDGDVIRYWMRLAADPWGNNPERGMVYQTDQD